MSTRFIRTAFFAAITLGAPAVAMADKPVASITAPKAAATDEVSSYAQRETQEPQAAEYQGGFIESTGSGSVVVISGAALLAFVLLAIIIM